MASDKKHRKAANQARKDRQSQGGQFRHRDGDRRRRSAMTTSVKEALAQKQALLLLGAVLPPSEPEPN